MGKNGHPVGKDSTSENKRRDAIAEADTPTDWQQIKKAAKGVAGELRQTYRYVRSGDAYKAVKASIKDRKFKPLLTPNNPAATLLMEVAGIEGTQILQPYYRPDNADPDMETSGHAIKHPHTYGLKNFRVINLHLETGEMTTAWYHPPKEGFPTIAYCHGAFGALYDRKGQLEEFSKRGFGVIMAAYPGVKNNKQPPCGQIEIAEGIRFPAIDSSEKACIETGRAMVLYILNNQLGSNENDPRSRMRLKHKGGHHKASPESDPMKKIILFGESLGGAVAMQTALLLEKGEDEEAVKWAAVSGQIPIKSAGRRHPKYGRESLTVPAVICWAPFTALTDRAHEEFPGFNADFWLNNRFETKKAIPKINYNKTKVLLMHGLKDQYTKPEHTERLLEYSGKNPSKPSGYNADAVFLEGCNHGSTVTDESWERDPAQLKKIGDTAQQYLANLGLCPPVADVAQGDVGVKWVASGHVQPRDDNRSGREQ